MPGPANPYVVEGRLGRGSTGVVELAVAPSGERVALKRLALHGSAEELAGARTRLRREAEVLARLAHPAIVPLLDVLEDGDDLVLVLPWLQGGNLADRVRRHGPLPATEVERLADHLLPALAAAHRAGIVHRDITPANVLFDDTSRPHLADFGVASARDLTGGLTGSGTALGTPGFLAPEQARGERATAAADVFCLGATLRFALTGSGPYGSGDRDVLLWRAARGRIEPLPRTVPAPLRRQLAAMLDPRPGRRPAAAELAPGPDGTEARPARTGSAARRRRRLAAGAAAGLAVGGLGLATALVAASSPDAAVDEASGDAAPDATAPCRPLPYQACGDAPAPGTDGRRCIDARADYDGLAGNGCEAVPDPFDGDALLGVLEPNLVPATDVDEFPLTVDDGPQLLCDGELTVTLTAPAGVSLRLEVLDAGGDLLGEVTSADGSAGAVRVGEPSCGGDDGQVLTARVTPIGTDRTAAPYRLERAGGF